MIRVSQLMHSLERSKQSGNLPECDSRDQLGKKAFLKSEKGKIKISEDYQISNKEWIIVKIYFAWNQLRLM